MASPPDSAVVDVPVTGGVNEAVYQDQVPPGSLLAATNVFYKRSGALSTRPGAFSSSTTNAIRTPAVSPTGYASPPSTLTSIGHIVESQGDVYAFSENIAHINVSGTGAWARQGRVSPMFATRSTVANSVLNLTSTALPFVPYWSETAYSSTQNLYCTVFLGDTATGTGKVYAVLQSPDTGAVVATHRLDNSGTALMPRVLTTSAGWFVALWQDGTNIVYTVMNGSGSGGNVYAWSTVGTLIAGVANTATGSPTTAWSSSVDAKAIDSNRIIVSYIDTSRRVTLTRGTIGYGTFTSTTTTTIETLGGAYRTVTSCDWYSGGSYYWVGYCYENPAGTYTSKIASLNTSVALMRTSTHVTGTATYAICAVGAFPSDKAVMVTARNGQTGSVPLSAITGEVMRTTMYTETGSAHTVANNFDTYNVWPYTKPFVVLDKASNPHAYMGVTQPSPDSGYAHTLQFCELPDNTASASSGTQTAFPVGIVAPRVLYAYGRTSAYNCAPRGVNLVSGKKYVSSCILYRTADGKVGVDRLNLDLQNPEGDQLPLRRQSAPSGQLLAITGGQPMFGDGSRQIDIGFPEQPYINVRTAAGASSLAGGAYSVAVVFSWTDNRGHVHRSEPTKYSFPVGSPVAAGDRIIVEVLYTGMSAKQTAWGTGDPVRVEFYMTRPGGNVYYLLDSYLSFRPNSITDVGLSQTITNDATTSSPTLYDYQTVASQSPPSSRFVAFHKDRVWLAGCDDQYTLYYSTVYIPGEAPVFNDLQTYRLDQDGPITGIASLDGNLVVFKERKIYLITGEGPTDLGQNSDYQETPLATDVGTTAGSSIVQTDRGLTYLGKRGFFTLSRGFDVQYSGARVRTQTETYTSCTAAVPVPDYGHIRYYMNNPSDGTTKVLVYDYSEDAWTTWDYSATAGNISAAAYSSDGALFIAPQGGAGSAQYLWQDWQSDFDALTPFVSNGEITQTVSFPWLRVAGIAGYQQVSELEITGQAVSAAPMTATVYQDYLSSSGQTSTTFTGTTGQPFRFLVSLDASRRKVTAIRCVLSWTRRLDLFGISWTVSNKGGIARLPAIQRS